MAIHDKNKQGTGLTTQPVYYARKRIQIGVKFVEIGSETVACTIYRTNEVVALCVWMLKTVDVVHSVTLYATERQSITCNRSSRQTDDGLPFKHPLKTMHPIPPTLWNAIAKGQPLSQPWSIVFNMAPEQLQQALEELVNLPLRATGADEPTLQAYRTVAPLLVEHAAISTYVAQQHDSSLRAALPEITCVGDAVMFAEKQSAYAESKGVTEFRMYMEAMDKILPNVQKILLGGNVKIDNAELWISK